jgi:hypothetical protein
MCFATHLHKRLEALRCVDFDDLKLAGPIQHDLLLCAQLLSLLNLLLNKPGSCCTV